MRWDGMMATATAKAGRQAGRTRTRIRIRRETERSRGCDLRSLRADDWRLNLRALSENRECRLQGPITYADAEAPPTTSNLALALAGRDVTTADGYYLLSKKRTHLTPIPHCQSIDQSINQSINQSAFPLTVELRTLVQIACSIMSRPHPPWPLRQQHPRGPRSRTQTTNGTANAT